MPGGSHPLRKDFPQTAICRRAATGGLASRAMSNTTPLGMCVVPARQKTSGFGVLEELRVQLMALQQFVELRAVAFGQPRGLRHVAVGDAQDLREVVALELAPRVFERRELGLLVLDRLLHQGHRYEGRGGERD